MSEFVIGLMNHISCCCVLGKKPIQVLAFMGLCWGAPWPSTWPWALCWCWGTPGAEISVRLSRVFSAAVFPSLTLSQPKQLYQELESKLPFSFSSIPRKESFLRMKLCLQIFAQGIVATHIIFSLWNIKLREAHSLLLFAVLPKASLEAASWLDTGTTMNHNILVFQKYCTEVLCMWALCSYPNSPCVIFHKCLPSLWYILWKLRTDL